MDYQQENALPAYVYGFFLGDGGLYLDAKRYKHRIYFIDQDIECITRVQKLLEGKGNVFRHASNAFRYELCSKEIFAELAVNTSMRTRAPQFLFSNADPDWMKEFVAGLMDSGGTVAYKESEGYSRWMMRFNSTSREIVVAILFCLVKLGLRVGNPGESLTANSRIYYHVQPKLEDFAKKGLYMYNERKMYLLNQYMMQVHASETLYTAPSQG